MGKESVRVYLVGGGPGDPGLITVRGVEVLRLADVVLYDRLASPVLLDYAPPEAQRLYVGKEPEESSRQRQARIHRLLIEHARAGRVVVRLKGGDPYVFGRGGEEALALSEAGIPFEVIPGVSAAVSAPGSVGIPLTQRGISSAFAVFAGRESADKKETGIDWELAARIPTAVFLMGVNRLPVIVQKLLTHGRAENTPIAVIERATLPDQRVTVSTLAEILECHEHLRPPATIVVGEVAALHLQVQDFLRSRPNDTISDLFPPFE